MVSLSKAERFFAAHCALLFTTSIAAILVAFALAWLARRRRDPARWCLALIKFAALFYILFCFVEFCADAVWIAFSRLMHTVRNDYDRFHHKDDLKMLATLLQARIELDAASRFTDCLVIIFIFLSIVFLGVGVNLVRTGERSSFDTLIKRASYAFAAILGTLAVIEWAIRIKAYLEFYSDKYDLDKQEKSTIQLLNASRQMDFAFVVIAWALSISVMIRSTQIWLPSRYEKRLDFPLMYLMLCSGAWLVRTTYELVYQLKFVNIQDIRKNRNEPSFMEIITIFFHTWPIFLIVCFMFALGVKKNDGLWSTEQPFMTQNSDGSQDVPLQPQDSRRDSSLHNTSGQESSARVSSPPAYTSSLGSNRSAQRLMPNNSSANPPSAQRPNGQPRQGQQPSGSRRQELGAHDRGLVANLGPPQQYQPPVRDNAYNTGIVSPVTPSEAGPADGFGTSMSIPSQSPPPHDEAMGLYHQADGRPPGMEPLPYPEKN